MSKFNEEYHSLLQDEESDIFNRSPKFQRRLRCSSSGRARLQAKGAAYIITRWPDHLSTLLAYWWIGLGMIALLIFIIYNSIIAVAILPPAPLKPSKILNRHFNILNTSHENFAERNVYMHIFVNSYEESNIIDYLPYVETYSKKYTNFTFNFIVVINDASKHIEDYSDELKNELALDSLWSEKQYRNRQMQKKPVVQIVSLSKYMDESPLKKYWRELPEKIIGFLSRCIAIWNKGGIALNPIIFTPKSPNPIYIEKLEEILGGTKIYMNISNSSKKTFKKPRRKVNNIQDIINTLENEDNIDHIDLTEAESIQKPYIDKKMYKHESKRNTKKIDINENFTSTYNSDKVTHENDSHDIPNNKNYFKHLYTTKSKSEDKDNNNDDNKQNLLPMFLKYLFRRNSDEHLNSSVRGKENTTKEITASYIGSGTRNKIKSIPVKDYVKFEYGSVNTTDRSLPKFVEANNFEKISKANTAVLTIDLNGNLIASATPCHAFIGTIFSNVFHHTYEESIKDLIITELSIFCKGTLSSCSGIDVILI